MSTPMRWGIAGCGAAAAAFAEALRLTPTGELIAVGSDSLQRARRLAERWSIPRAYGGYDELLADDQLDAVFLALPPDLHYRWAIRGAERGKHLLCEPPLALNSGEAMTMIEMARRHHIVLMEALPDRDHPGTARLVQLIRDGAIGEIHTLDIRFSGSAAQHQHDREPPDEVAIGSILTSGAYCVSMARLLAGAAAGHACAEPEAVKGFARLDAARRVDRSAMALLRFRGDLLANLSCGTSVPNDHALAISGSTGSIHVPTAWLSGREAADSTISVSRAGQVDPEVIQIAAAPPPYTRAAALVAQHSADQQAPSPDLSCMDRLGTMRTLDLWRREVPLVFDREQMQASIPPFFSSSPRPDHEMKYGQVAGVDKPISRIVMGSLALHSDRLPYSFALLDYFVEQGGTCIDTAWAYGGNATEKAIRAWLAQRQIRDRVVILGKGAASVHCTPEMVSTQLLDSLERLQTDHIDIFLMHRDNPRVPVDEFVECLNEHQRAGRIRAFGGSNWTPERLTAANAYAAAHGLTGFAASSPNVSLAVWNEPAWSDCLTASDPSSRAWYARTRLPLFAWSSQAGGFFAGSYRPDDRHDPTLRNMVRVWFNPDNFRRRERARELAASKGVTANQIALAYVLCQPLEVFAIIGPQTIEELRTSLATVSITLTPAELRWLNLEDEP